MAPSKKKAPLSEALRALLSKMDTLKEMKNTRDTLTGRIIKNKEEIMDLIDRVAKFQAETAKKKNHSPKDVQAANDIHSGALAATAELESINTAVEDMDSVINLADDVM